MAKKDEKVDEKVEEQLDEKVDAAADKVEEKSVSGTGTEKLDGSKTHAACVGDAMRGKSFESVADVREHFARMSKICTAERLEARAAEIRKSIE